MNGMVYRVEFASAKGCVCQIVEPDARIHPDVKSLPRLVNALLGCDWMDRSLREEQAIAALWAPCLSKEEVDCLFESPTLMPLRQTLWDGVSFWSHARLVDISRSLPYSEGEIFFVTEEYHLLNLAIPVD